MCQPHHDFLVHKIDSFADPEDVLWMQRAIIPFIICNPNGLH